MASGGALTGRVAPRAAADGDGAQVLPELNAPDVSGTHLSSDNHQAPTSKGINRMPQSDHTIASGTILGESSVQELMALQSASKLTHLALDGCGLRDSAVEVLLTTLSGKSGDGLTTLSLRDNTIGADGARASSPSFSDAPPCVARCVARLTGGGGEQSAALDLLVSRSLQHHQLSPLCSEATALVTRPQH